MTYTPISKIAVRKSIVGEYVERVRKEHGIKLQRTSSAVGALLLQSTVPYEMGDFVMLNLPIDPENNGNLTNLAYQLDKQQNQPRRNVLAFTPEDEAKMQRRIEEARKFNYGSGARRGIKSNVIIH